MCDCHAPKKSCEFYLQIIEDNDIYASGGIKQSEGD